MGKSNSDSPISPIEKLLTQSDVAEWLQVTNRTLERWRDVRKGPKYRKIGGAVRYVRQDVQDWIDGQIVETNLKLV